LTLLNNDIIEFIKKYNIGLGVSLDGLSEYHDNARLYKNGKGSFARVMMNLNNLLSKGIRPSISTVISNNNLEGLSNLTKYLVDNKLRFRYSIVHGEEVDKDKLIVAFQESYSIIEEAIVSDNFSIIENHNLCDLKFIDLFFQTCVAGLSGGAINCDGDIYYCHTLFEKTPLGNIYEPDDLLEIFARGNKIQLSKSEECNNCIYKYICSSGCSVYRQEGKDINCDFYKFIIPKVFELIAKERLTKIKQISSEATFAKDVYNS
jgi:uncharacterized protein